MSPIFSIHSYLFLSHLSWVAAIFQRERWLKSFAKILSSATAAPEIILFDVSQKLKPIFPRRHTQPFHLHIHFPTHTHSHLYETLSIPDHAILVYIYIYSHPFDHFKMKYNIRTNPHSNILKCINNKKKHILPLLLNINYPYHRASHPDPTDARSLCTKSVTKYLN